MSAYPVPEDEADRQRVLDDYHLLDGASSEQLDRLTRLASRMLGLPIALISLVDRDRQWFLSRVGIDASQTSRDVAFCAHAICGEGVMVVPDARQDARFRDNPLVQGAPHIRFYAGAPLETHDGHKLGTLCVIGQEPRPMTGSECELLRDLADLVTQDLETRRRSWRCPLTGLLNRRPFFEEGERDVAHARERQAPLALVLLDLDGFAALNERFGRAFGDGVLRQVAALLLEACRPSDLLARISATDFAHDGAAIPLTASAAVAELHPEDASFADLFRRAEQGLRRARQRGRHLIVTAPPAAAAGPDGPGAGPG